MGLFKCFIVVFLATLLIPVFAYADEVVINSIDPLVLPVVSDSSLIKIYGKGFGNYSASRIIFLKDGNKWTDDLQKNDKKMVEKWVDDTIITHVPEALAKVLNQSIPGTPDSKSPKVSIRVLEAKNTQTSNTVLINAIVHDVVAEAIRLKKTQISDQGIIDLLFNQQEKFLEKDPDAITEGLFGAVQLSPDDVRALKDAGFDEKFIAKLGGQHQYFSIGASAIYLFGSDEWVGAGLARIFLRPKGYYSPRKPIVSRHWSFETNLNRLVSAPLRSNFWDRVDMIIGVTGSASTSNNQANSSNTSYVVTGGSLEITRFLHLVGGAVFAPNKTKGDRYQPYIGINIDPNIVNIDDFLKNVNILKQ